MVQRGVIFSALLLGVIAGAGVTRFVYDKGLFSLLDVDEYLGGISDGTSKRKYDFKERANLSESKDWAALVNTRNFQKRSSFDKNNVRDQYYNDVIAPTLPKLGAEDAKEKFQEYAAVAEKLQKGMVSLRFPLNFLSPESRPNMRPLTTLLR